MQLTLDQIAIEQGTDKATKFTRTYAKPKGYTVHYERVFEPLRDKPIRLVEIGVGGGESIRTWLYYFLCAEVIGIDNVSNTNEWNTPKRLETDYDPGDLEAKYHARHAFHAADQTDPTFWACFAADYGQTIDIAIDDGSHEPKAVQMSFTLLWPLIKPGGLYCIEDLGCGFTNPGYSSHGHWVSELTGQLLLNGTGDIDSIYIAKELCIIRKKLCTPP